MDRGSDHGRWVLAVRVGLALFVAFALHAFVVRDDNAAYSFSILGVAAALYARLFPRPAALGALVVAVALGNAAGFGWELYTRVPPYDELAHAATPFVLALALGTAFVARARVSHGRGVVFFLVASSGIAVCALWEIVEWTTSKVWSGYSTEDIDDTITDLMLGVAGAVGAALVVARPARPGPA